MAQINCADIKGLPDFPQKGLLQFWVQGDPYKMYIDHGKKDHQVIYIENPVNNNIDNVELDESIYNLDYSGDFPWIQVKNYNHSDNLLFTTSKEMVVPNTADREMLVDIIEKVASEVVGSNIDKNQLLTIIDAVDDDDRFEPTWGDRVGGYPSFTQNGPTHRGKNSDDTLLLQLDSEKGVQWGDSGIASFFMSHDDLVKKNFNNVSFYWDCH